MTSENICWFHIFFVIFCALNANTVTATGELLKKYISEPKAICNDNSRATFYIGTKASKKWIVFFESGRFCSSFADCNRRYLSKNSTMLMTSKMLPDRVTGRDFLSASSSENPAFFQYNHVLVPYCSSDLWLGLKTNPNKPFSFVNDSFVDNFSFRGQTIFRSVFADLLQHHDLADAEEIILAGSSAGGIGVLNHADWVLKHVVETNTFNARLLSLIDSAWFIDFQDSLRDMVNPKFTSFANISSRACLDYSPGHTCCPSATCMIARGYYPASVPLLLISSMYDIFMFGEVFKKLEAEGKASDEYSADYISALNMYGGAMNESLSSLNVSFFVPACFQHIYFATSSLWDENGIFPPSMEVAVANAKVRNTVQREYWEKTKIPIGSKKISIRDFVTTWVKSPDGSMKVTDSCIGAQCNPTCPKQLFFIDPAVNWVEVVKTCIIILSLLITVTCFGLKAVFMLYQYYLSKKQKQYLTETETVEVHKEGAVFINGVPRSLGNVHKWYARKIGYVLQLAVPYYEELTVRQNLLFAAHMRLPKSMSNAKKFERVEQILAEIGLTSLADTVVGLDASSSLELLNHLNLVAESGRLVILTIHQPRLEIFHLFHKIIFMYDGQVAYYGEPTLAPTLFLKAYLQSTTEGFRLSEDAPKIDATNPAGTIYFRAQDEDGILLMSAFCVYCCASPLFLSSVLMAHLNKALNVMTSYDLWKFFLVTIISLVLNQTWIAVYMMVICAHPGIAHRICPMVSACAGFAGGFLVPRPQMPAGSSKISRSQVDRILHESIELLNGADHAVNPTRRKSTLGIVTHDDGLHTVKLPNSPTIPSESRPESDAVSLPSKTSSVSSRENRWSSVRKRTAERKRSSHLEMKHVQRIAKQSALVQSNQVQSQKVRTRKQAVPLPRKTRYSSVPEDSEKKAPMKRTYSYHETADHNLADSALKMTTLQSATIGVDDHREASPSQLLRSVTFPAVEEGDQEMISGPFYLESICEHDDTLGSEEEEDTANVFVDNQL
ncbi:Protein notum-like [Stylophora pistillata]|uniref:Protein notum-like n=1 Tax=Stylophora pistillata TaxID=50429 RepID=A0A2B4SQ96_STYPI|nr:Protein notum-like [Stylophora pistillata]